MRAHPRWTPFALGLLLASLAAAPARAAGTQAVTIDGRSGGRTFDGIGALSAGGSSRLLIDYPEPQRTQILDYLFTPGYGAALQILKVEIGGDANSTDGAEPGHMRTPSEVDCGRGYEWWLMEQAKARNPRIALSALQWGAPGWAGTGAARPTVWTGRDVDYLTAWLGCARRHHLHIDYLGGWNEGYSDAGWYVRLHEALRERGFGDTKVVADDSFNWDVVPPLTRNAAFRSAVDVVGQHYVCGYLSDYLHCPSPATARSLGKPLAASEQGSLPYDSGARPLARALSRPYIDGGMTSTVNWALIASWYDTMPFQGSGLMGANEPWSGAYVAGPSLWVMAHTTQFTRRGWRYVDSAKGYLDHGGSYVALRDPRSGDYSLVVETIDATAPQRLKVTATGGLSAAPVNVWSSDLSSSDARRWFRHDPSVRSGDTVTLEPGHLYTLSTTRGQGRGKAVSPPAAPLRLPYRDGFDAPPGTVPPYVSDLDGAFEVAPCTGRAGGCLRQVISEQPVWWNGWLKRPVTLVGDLKSWRDYRAHVDVRLEQDGWTELLGRVDGQWGDAVSGVHLRLSSGGEWQLYDENLQGQDSALCVPSNPSCAGITSLRPRRPVHRRTFAQGHAPVTGRDWHRLGLAFAGDQVTAYLDGRRIARVNTPVHASGQVGLGVSPWRNAQFDDLAVLPARTTGGLRYLPAQRLSATGTGFHLGDEPRKAVDGSVQSMWHSEWSPRSHLPQTITVDTGGVNRIGEITYQPREDGNANGVITRYELATSVDGITWQAGGRGAWPRDATRKAISLQDVTARFVRLTALAAGGGFASAAEIQVAVR